MGNFVSMNQLNCLYVDNMKNTYVGLTDDHSLKYEPKIAVWLVDHQKNCSTGI